MNKTTIENFNSVDLPELINFNKNNFNHSNEEEFFNHRFVTNPAKLKGTNYIVMVKNTDNKIVGQSMFLPMTFMHKGTKQFGAWGTDLIVDKSCRGTGIGKRLVLEFKKVTNQFILGVTPSSLSILKKNDFHILDEFKRYIYIPSLWGFLSLFLKSKSKVKPIPQQVNTSDNIFTLQKEAPHIEKENWNHEIIEFSRDYDFLKWRFFGTYKHFYFYYNDNKNTPVYFVIKILKWKGHSFIVLVDMRLQKNDKNSFNSIIEACKAILSQTGAKGIISGSSLREFTEGFKKNGFFNFEKPTSIITASKYGESYPYFKQQGIFVTMGDSDYEYVYKLKGKLHHRIIKAYWQKIKNNKI